MESSLLTFQTTVLGLLLVACLSAIALRKLHFPYTIGLVIVGLALGFTSKSIPGIEALTSLNLSHESILFLFLPPLIFESALTLNARLLLRNITPVLVLATAGLLIATGIVSVVMVWLTPLNWQESLLFGALISATDPVAVIALFKELGVPKQLVVLVEGESLFNDATAIVTFNLIMAAGAMQTDNIALEGLQLFFSSFFGGIVVGAILAWLTSYLLIAAWRNSFIQGTLSAILAFGTFILAEHYLHFSGVIAVLSAGMVTSWIVSVQLKLESRQFLHELWEYLSFLTNSLIFLLVGLASAQVLIQVEEIGILLTALGVAIAAVLLSRTVAVFTLFTLLVPGTTMGGLLNWLGFNKSYVLDRLETAEATVTANHKALKALSDLSLEGEQYRAEIDQISHQVRQALDEAQRQLHGVWNDRETDPMQRREATWLQAIAF